MRLWLEPRPAEEAPLADLPFGLRIRARASAERKDGHHTGRIFAYVPNPSQALLAHEADHDLDDHKAHHPWWHFCGRVGHALRLRPTVHLHPDAWRAAGELRATGQADTGEYHRP